MCQQVISVSKILVLALAFATLGLILDGLRSCRASDGAEVLTKARNAVFELQCIKYSFRYSRYGDCKLDFSSDGIKTKCYASAVPGTKGPVPMLYAFDGNNYQKRTVTPDGGLYAFSKSPLGGSNDLTCGPCWTPIEKCYSWLEIAKPDFRWSHIKDPAVWAALDPQSCTVISEPDRDIRRVAFDLGSGRSMAVDFAANYNFFPVRMLVSSEKDPSQYVTIVEATRFESVEGRYFPSEVDHTIPAHETTPERRSHYNLLPESITFVCSTDSKAFAVFPEKGDQVYDWDKNEGYVFGTDVKNVLVPNRVENQPRPSRFSVSWQFVFWNVIFLACAGVLWLFQKRRSLHI